ncbi:MAG: flagellar motor switch protein FliN [candidate division Zixibacteria bacterium]|nr:flagellar motor switch protein FliN [candidate division Zixibacteria bacterium]
MPDEIKPDGSLDEEQGSVSGVEDSPSEENEDAAEAENAEGADGAAEAEKAEGGGIDADAVSEMGQDDIDALVNAETGGDDPEVDKVVNENDASEDDAEAAMLRMLEEESGEDSQSEGSVDEFPDLSGVQMEQPAANPVEFQQLSPSGSSNENSRNIEMLLDVKMQVSIELGRTEMAISDLLTLGPGSVVELNKLAGEPVDLLVNNVVIAKGEVVVVDENFGVRVTLLMSPEERLKSMAQL